MTDFAALEYEPPFHTYIIARDEYMGVACDMESWEGTFRGLLFMLLGLEPMQQWEGEDIVRVNGKEYTSPVQMPDDILLEWFNDANGDGQQYVMVWDVTDGKQVLG